jgi:hypothetical protein
MSHAVLAGFAACMDQASKFGCQHISTARFPLLETFTTSAQCNGKG